jgi:TolB-like protein
VWGLVEKGDDLLRQDLPRKAQAVALDRSGRALAVAGEDGRVSTFKVSGATLTDCETYARAKKPGQAAAGPKISLGTDNSPLLEAKGNPRVAVLRFETTNASSDLGDTLAELISGELSNNANVVVVERKAIDAIVKEMETQRSGLTESAAVALIGKGLNAKKVFFGSVRRLGDDLFILTVRLVDVETQRIEGYREVSCERCREQDVLSAARELRKLLVR